MVKNLVRKILVKLGLHSEPDFIMLGAQKAGTTGLFSTLSQHNNIHSRTKEIHYFDNDDWYHEEKIDEYHIHFPLKHQVSTNGKVFEATPLYLYHPEVPYRLNKYNPDLKLIVVLRNPVDRALSAWTMYHYHFETGRDSEYYDERSFGQAINEELEDEEKLDYYKNKKGYVARGLYYKQLVDLFRYFPKENVLILENKEVFQMKEETSRKIQSFIGVPYNSLKTIVSNKAKVKLDSDYSQEKTKLYDFFAPHNEQLFELIGKRYDWDMAVDKKKAIV